MMMSLPLPTWELVSDSSCCSLSCFSFSIVSLMVSDNRLFLFRSLLTIAKKKFYNITMISRFWTHNNFSYKTCFVIHIVCKFKIQCTKLHMPLIMGFVRYRKATVGLIRSCRGLYYLNEDGNIYVPVGKWKSCWIMKHMHISNRCSIS